MTDIRDLTNSMRDRMPWPVARRIFEENEVVRGRGWEQTISKLGTGRFVDDDKLSALRESLKEHALCGEKITRFYSVETEALNRVYEIAQDLQPPSSAFADRFPSLLTEEQLEGLPLGHQLIHVEEEDGVGISLVFASVRSVSTRVELGADDLPAGADELMERFDELVGVKNKRVQGLDVVWLPFGNDTVEVRIDFPQGMLRQAAEAAHASVRGALESLLGEDILTSPQNLFAVIKSMYYDQNEGSVVELAFGTTTAALKHEKMRRGDLSLRDEKYHKGGLAALSEHISPFKVSIEWTRSLGNNLISKPELNLHTNSRIGGSEEPRLIDAIIRNCMGRDDYEFVLERVRHHLPRVDPE